MTEISGLVLNYIKEKAKEKKYTIKDESNYENEKWYDYKIFENYLNQLEKQKNKTLWTDISVDLYTRCADENLIDTEDSPNNAVINVHKLYLQIIRGESTGIWKTSDLQDGFSKIEENSVFPELFTKGVLTGLLKHYSCIGPVVKQTKSRYMEEEVYFNEFELTWMKKIK